MGTEGMKASLDQSRSHRGLDRTGRPRKSLRRNRMHRGLRQKYAGTVMAMARLDIPGLMLYGGSIAPGHANGKDITIQDVFEGIGAHARGTIDDAGLEVLEAAACPGAGACGGQFTANTMAMACEFLGISPIGLSGVPALSPDKHAASRRAGELIMEQPATTCGPASSLRLYPSRMQLPALLLPADRPMLFCIFSPSHTRWASRFPSTTSIASPRALPCSAT